MINIYLFLKMSHFSIKEIWQGPKDASALGVINLVRTKIFQKTNISWPLIRTPNCAYQGIRNVSFSKNVPTY